MMPDRSVLEEMQAEAEALLELEDLAFFWYCRMLARDRKTDVIGVLKLVVEI
jgi:hypothetical protein